MRWGGSIGGICEASSVAPELVSRRGRSLQKAVLASQSRHKLCVVSCELLSPFTQKVKFGVCMPGSRRVQLSDQVKREAEAALSSVARQVKFTVAEYPVSMYVGRFANDETDRYFVPEYQRNLA